MNGMCLTGRCAGVGELQVGQLCSATGIVGLPFPWEGWLLFYLEELEVYFR